MLPSLLSGALSRPAADGRQGWHPCIVRRRVAFASRAEGTIRPCGEKLAPAVCLRFDRRVPCAATPPPEVALLINDPLFYLLAAVAVILLGLSKGGFFGLGVMALPLLSIEVPPLQAAAIILPTVLAQDALTVWTYRRDWSAWNLRIMIPSMAAGIAIAGLFAASLTPSHIRLAVGLIAAAFVLRHWLRAHVERWSPRPGTLTGVLFGALGGVTTMLANAGGPAWQMHLLPQRLDKLTYVGAFTMLFAASNLLKIPAYGALGQLTPDNLAIGAALLPVAVVANYAGIWLVRRTPTELFYRIVYVLMFLIAVELIRSSVSDLLRA
jgi:uncharacterized protein